MTLAANREFFVLVGLIIWTIAFLIAGLRPFEFRRPARLKIWFRPKPLNGFLNFVCFLPFGILIANLPGLGAPVFAAAVYCGVLSFAAEATQLFIRGRFATVSDWILNTSGGFAGAYLYVLSPFGKM